MANKVQNESGKKQSAVEAEEARAVAPGQVTVQELLKDERRELIEKLNREDQENSYVYQDSRSLDIPRFLESKGLEVVKDAKGKPLTHGADIVCKANKEMLYKKKLKEETLSRLGVEGVVDADRSTVHSSVQKPKKLN